MARTKSSEQRRGDLLDAAERLVLADGVDTLKIDDVVVGAGVAKGTFYLHFASKDDLIAALRDRYVERFVAHQRQAADAKAGLARVEAWLLAGITAYLSDTRLHDVLFRHGSRTSHKPGPNLAVDALKRLLEDETTVPDPEATAIVLYHAMHGSADHILHVPEDRRRLLDEVARLCRALIGG
ncbi:TetR/AcrR family transcriptional regulator [Nonomuraea sp. SYSU D8015]|uniref:TetR/AcrR family transcriptional regulator n=1 Tax=Nonomuraea sp. SYSU D8015 TaxID=2593644 RepID=UPI001660BA13|nr:TetR/AcrR family transcriptional regulator [Nonomuraea sp. SYSU D8015]